GRVFIEVGGKVQLTNVRFRDNQQLMNICQRIVSQIGRRVDEASPICDARLPDGSRVNVIAPPLALDGPTLTIRKFKKDKLTMRDLVKNCRRMRPERIIVGEVRGPEAFDLLQAMNTGHDGSMGTLHANSPREAVSRIESMITMGGYGLPSKTIREMVVGSID